MAYCEQCGEKNVDGAAVCVKCGAMLSPGGGRQQQNYGENHGSSSYSPPAAAASAGSDPVTIGDWIITYLLMCIPLINFILLFVWAFDSNTKPSKKNWAKASLIWIAIVFGIMIMFSVLFGAAIVGLLGHAN